MSTGTSDIEYTASVQVLATQGDLAHTLVWWIRLIHRKYVTLISKGDYVGTKDQRTSRLNMRLTPAELSTIREAAAAAGQSVSAFMLAAALNQAAAQSLVSTSSS